MRDEDHGPGGGIGQVLQRPQQGALAVLELFWDGNEDPVVNDDSRALCRLAGVARESARGRSEAVPCALRRLSPRGTLHFRLATSRCRVVAAFGSALIRISHQSHLYL